MELSYAMNEYLSVQPASRDPFTVGPRQHLDQMLSIIAITRNGDYRFLPLVLSKVTEVLPKLVNPMLQNAPENVAMANIDIFDGFGNAGMAQPPPQLQMPMEEYDRKFTVEEYDKQYSMEMNQTTPESSTNSNHSTTGPATQATDVSGSFVSSPGIMSPGLEYTHNMNGYACTPMSEMVMSPLGNPHQNTSINNGQQQPQQQHMSRNTMNAATPHPGLNNMYGMRPAPQRQASFHLHNPPQMRTVGDFQGLQRGTSDAGGMVMGQMGNDMDFGGLR